MNPSSKKYQFKIVWYLLIDVIEAELTRQFQLTNTTRVRTIQQEKWLAHYNELIEYEKLNRSAAFMCGGKLGRWVNKQRTHYRLLQDRTKV